MNDVLTKYTKKKTRLEQKEETRVLILKTARELFLEHGYEKTTMRMIAQKAKVATGTAFNHFPDKTSILMATLYDDLENTTIQASMTIPAGAGFLDTLIHFAGKIFELYATKRELAKHMIKESLFNEGEWNDKVYFQFYTFNRLAQGLIDSAQKRGLVKPESNPNVLGESFMAIYIYVVTIGLKFNIPPDEQILMLRKQVESLFSGHLVSDSPACDK